MAEEPPAEPESRAGIRREDVASWLQGPASLRPEVFGFPGERLGLPHYGRGSVAGWGRRLVAVWVDWICALVIASALHRDSAGPSYQTDILLIFGVEVALLTALTGASFGQRLLRLRVVRVDGGRLAPLPVLVRTVLLCLAVPALIWDRDNRGLHDKAARSVVVNAR